MGWVLFVDESGDFDAEADEVCVGGLLAPAEILAIDGKTWRKALAQVFPPGWWPPHATELNQPAGVLAGWLVSGRQWMPRGVDASGLEHAERLLRSASGSSPLLQAYLSAVDRQRMPSWPDVVAASVALSANRPVFDWLQVGVRAVSLSMARLVEQLDRVLGHRLAVTMAFGGAESEPGHERYLEVLAALIERSCLVLSEPGGPVPLELTVATRGVKQGEHERMLATGDLEDARTSALAWLRSAPSLGNVEVRFGLPIGYDRNAPAGLVLADWLCNRARAHARHARAWPQLRATILRAAGSSAERLVTPLAKRLPTFAVSGPARDIIAGRQPLDGSLTGWRREVTSTWRDAVRRRT